MHKQASGAPFFFQTGIMGWIVSWPLFLVFIAKPLASWRLLFFQIRFAVELDLLGIMVTETMGMEWNLTQNQSWNRGHQWILEGSVEGVTFETGKIQKKMCVYEVCTFMYRWKCVDDMRWGGMGWFFSSTGKRGTCTQNWPQVNKSFQLKQFKSKSSGQGLFTEASNTFVIVTAHKQVCANRKKLNVTVF